MLKPLTWLLLGLCLSAAACQSTPNALDRPLGEASEASGYLVTTLVVDWKNAHILLMPTRHGPFPVTVPGEWAELKPGRHPVCIALRPGEYFFEWVRCGAFTYALAPQRIVIEAGRVTVVPTLEMRLDNPDPTFQSFVYRFVEVPDDVAAFEAAYPGLARWPRLRPEGLPTSFQVPRRVL